MYKSQLQEYAQKAGLMHPTYDHVKEGASHEPRFKSTVWVNNQSYESPPGFPTLRSAEHAAAKVALDFLQNTQTKGVVPSPVHESGLCKNLLQEFAQKNGYPLPQYKIMRQGEEHSLVFTAAVEIAGVSYSGGGGKSKKEAEIKAARTALLAIQASQPATGVGLPAVEPRPLAQPLPGQITNFVKSHQKKKKRGRTTPVLLEEPHAIRVKQGLGQVGGPVQLQQMHQVHPIHPMHPVPQVSQVSHVMHVPPMNQLPQPYSVNTVGYPGQSVLPVEWNQELGVSSSPAAVYSESMQVGNLMQQDTTMTQSAWNPVAPHGTEPTLNTPAENNLTTASGHTETAVVETQVATAKTEPAAVQQAPLEEHTVSLVTTEVKETITVTESHVSFVSTAEVVSVEPQISVPVEVTEELGAAQVSAVLEPVSGTSTETPASGAPQEPHTVTNGELQADIMRPMDFGIKSEAA